MSKQDTIKKIRRLIKKIDELKAIEYNEGEMQNLKNEIEKLIRKL